MPQPTILQMLQGAQQNAGGLGQIKQAITTLRSLSSPQTALQQLIQQRNPAMMQALDYVRQHGNNPRAAFEALAQERGIDPAEVDALLK